MRKKNVNLSGARQPKIGVVLGGGGLKALSSIALLKFLDEENLQPYMVAGCSAGALVAAMKGAGFSYDQMCDVAFDMADQDLFSSYNTGAVLGVMDTPGFRFDNSSGLMNPKAVKALYRKWFKDLLLQDLTPKTMLTATDIVKGEAAVLESGLVAEAVYASGALWPLFPPAEFEGCKLIDGGYTAPLPIYEAVRHGADVIIAMIFDEKPDPHPKNFAACLNNHIGTMLRTLSRSHTLLAIDMHNYEIILIQSTIELPQEMSEDAVPLVLETGRQMVRNNAENILSAVRNFKG